MLRLLLHAITKETQLTFEGRSYSFTEEIPQGHKIALIDLNKGDHVIKYGYPIGHLFVRCKKLDSGYIPTMSRPIFQERWLIPMSRTYNQ